MYTLLISTLDLETGLFLLLPVMCGLRIKNFRIRTYLTAK